MELGYAILYENWYYYRFLTSSPPISQILKYFKVSQVLFKVFKISFYLRPLDDDAVNGDKYKNLWLSNVFDFLFP